MAYNLTISAGSMEQTEAVTIAVRAALAERGMALPEPDAQPSNRKEMFPSGEVVHYTLETIAAIGVSVVANAIYARLKFLHPKDDIDNDPTGSGFEVVNHTTGARVEIDDGSDDERA